MGRNWTGIRTVEESRKLDIRLLFKYSQIVKGKNTAGVIEWEDGAWVAYESCYTNEDKYFKIGYTLIDSQTNISRKYQYKIEIETVKSNLGVGEIPYLICPLTGDRAKVLIMAYGNDKYIHRAAYGSIVGRIPLYYRVQQVSIRDYHNARFFKLKKKYDELYSQLFENDYVKRSYSGSPTKNMFEFKQLSLKMNYHNIERNKLFIDKFHKFINPR